MQPVQREAEVQLEQLAGQARQVGPAAMYWVERQPQEEARPEVVLVKLAMQVSQVT